MSGRIVKPEILDHLAPDDSEARRSRRDLRLVNALMGNERWILKTVRNFPEHVTGGVTEIGAGDGILLKKLAALLPETKITAFDLAPRPPGLDQRIDWRQGDLFKSGSPIRGGMLIANLFLHHFEGEALRELGRICEDFKIVIFNEPARGTIPHLLGALIDPLINRVTRHDMHVSIDAGFCLGELQGLMGLSGWRIREYSTWRGALRVVGCRV